MFCRVFVESVHIVHSYTSPEASDGVYDNDNSVYLILKIHFAFTEHLQVLETHSEFYLVVIICLNTCLQPV